MRQARATLLLYQEIQRAREDDMVGILQSSLFDGTPRVADSAGAATAANDLPAQWKEARRQTQLCKARFERLKYRYEPELVKYLRNARASREAFDQTFCRDRAQATRDWLQADNRCRSLQRRLREAQLARLSDLTSNFGSIPGDGHTETMGTEFEQFCHRRRRLNHTRMTNYRSRVLLAGAPVDAAAAPSVPIEIWNGRLIAWGGSDCPSHEAVNSNEKKRIRAWKQEAERLRLEPNYGAVETGYTGGGFQADKDLGFSNPAPSELSSSGTCCCC